MMIFVRVFLLAIILGCRGTQGQVISEPHDVTVCEGREAVLTCVLNSNIRSDDVQWYRFIKDTSTTEMVDPNEDDIYFITDTIGNTTSSSLTITNVIKSYTGYFWVVTPSLTVCNASLTVLTSPPIPRVNVVENIGTSSIVVQWDAVDDSLIITYTIVWSRAGGGVRQVATLTEQTSYTITGLTLDTVYNITVTAANTCGSGPEIVTTVSLSLDTTSTTSSISPTVTASTNSMSISIATTSSTIVTTTTYPMIISTTANATTFPVINPSVTTINSIITIENENIIITRSNTNIETTTITVTITKQFNDTVFLSTSSVKENMANKNNSGIYDNECSRSSIVAVGAITFAVTFILTLIVTAIITFIVAYVCVKRTLEKNHSSDDFTNKSPQEKEKVLYEEVHTLSHTVSGKNDLELQPNPAYGTSDKVIMDTNPAYASCK